MNKILLREIKLIYFYSLRISIKISYFLREKKIQLILQHNNL